MSPTFSIDADGFQIAPLILQDSEVDSLIGELAGLEGKRSATGSRARHYGARNLLANCPTVAALAQSQSLMQWIKPVLGAAAFPVRAMLFDKLPGANWQVGWHQDLSIAVAERVEVAGFTGWSVKQGVQHVQPPASILEDMLTARIHLDDCDEDNGPLRVIRGSHRQGRLDDKQIEHSRRTGEEATCLVPRGGILLMRPLLLHASSPAKNPRHRRVIHLEYASDPLPARLRWFEQRQ